MQIEIGSLHGGVGELIIWATRNDCAYCQELHTIEDAEDAERELKQATARLQTYIQKYMENNEQELKQASALLQKYIQKYKDT